MAPEDLEYETEHEHRKRNWSAQDLVIFLTFWPSINPKLWSFSNLMFYLKFFILELT